MFFSKFTSALFQYRSALCLVTDVKNIFVQLFSACLFVIRIFVALVVFIINIFNNCSSCFLTGTFMCSLLNVNFYFSFTLYIPKNKYTCIISIKKIRLKDQQSFTNIMRLTRNFTGK